jgi:hypothetical protein
LFWPRANRPGLFLSTARLLLATKDNGDAGQLPVVLKDVGGEIASVTAVYDGEASCAAVAARQTDPLPDVVIPPRSSAVPGTAAREVRRTSPVSSR